MSTAFDGTSDSNSPVMSWPLLQWRGDGQRRALTCGTLLHIIGVEGGPWNETEKPGVRLRTVLSEITRVAAKYDPERDATLSDRVIRGGDMMVTDKIEVVKIIGLLHDVSGVIQIVTPDDVVKRAEIDADARTGVSVYIAEGDDIDTVESESKRLAGEIRLKLTQKGQERLTALTLLAQSDKRFAHIDLGDPILEYNPILDVVSTIDESTAEKQERERMAKAEEAHADAMLPKRRYSSARPTYRLWMWIVKQSPLSYAYASTKTPADVALTPANTAVGEPYERCATLISQALFIRPFLDLVLSGGPEGIWNGKPITQHGIHHDVETFAAANRSGFNEEIVKMSSLAWEMFDLNDTPSTDFKDKTFALKKQAEQRAIVDVLDEAIAAHKIENDEAVPHAMANTVYTGRLMYRESPEVYQAGKVVLKTTADALMDALREEGFVLEASDGLMMDWKRMAGTAGSSELAPRVRCTFRKGTGSSCRYWSIGGTGKCELHGGRLIDEDETRSLLRANQVKIFAASGKALDTVLYLMENSANDAIRLRAAETVMNRAGLSEKSEYTLDVGIAVKEDNIKQDPGEIVRERLKRLERAALPEAVDAEVVETVDEQDRPES